MALHSSGWCRCTPGSGLQPQGLRHLVSGPGNGNSFRWNHKNWEEEEKKRFHLVPTSLIGSAKHITGAPKVLGKYALLKVGNFCHQDKLIFYCYFPLAVWIPSTYRSGLGCGSLSFMAWINLTTRPEIRKAPTPEVSYTLAKEDKIPGSIFGLCLRQGGGQQALILKFPGSPAPSQCIKRFISHPHSKISQGNSTKFKAHPDFRSTFARKYEVKPGNCFRLSFTKS